jgi:hypothetical protein
MPLHKPEDHGTEADGQRAEEYCRFCYQHGGFTYPATISSMIELCARILSDRGVPYVEAQQLMMQTIPQLKRWRASADRATA